MKWTILHELPGRIRVHMAKPRMTLAEADVLEDYVKSIPGVASVKVYDRTCDALIVYTGPRGALIAALASFTYAGRDLAVQPRSGRALNRTFEDKLFFTLAGRVVRRTLLPVPVRQVWAVLRAVKYAARGLRCLLRGRIEVPVLDAVAVSAAILRGDFGTASSIMFLLKIGEILEEWTHRKSVDDLAQSMALNVDKAWVKTDGADVLMPVNRIAAGDRVVVRTGSMIPLDGRVESGEATVNQSSMTGESVPVAKSAGSLVYAGTVVEEGECIFRVEKTSGTGRYDRIVQMIEASEKLKSATEDRASHLADRLVPYSLGATVLTYLLTRNVTKAMAILMVDFSCALKLSMPIAVLSAMKEATGHHISFKGGKFIEAVAEADTIVFDKTGTLTHAAPHVAQIVPFDGAGGMDETALLRIAACMEEHYPHSIANAVVREAQVRGISHEECHSSVEYVVAHGIRGEADGRRIVIGSAHFAFEDEHCTVPNPDRFAALPDQYSHLYMCVDGQLAAVICIEDPLRAEAADVIAGLRHAGFSHIVMMTGDSARTARTVADRLGITEYHAEVLPEDKADYVRRMRAAGHRVVMIGDGVNDTPALSEADAGVSVDKGAAVAREIADVTITTDDLRALLAMKALSAQLMRRIHANYRFIISFNLGLIILGVMGVLPPATSALLHNLSTLGIGLKSMTPLLGEETDARNAAKS